MKSLNNAIQEESSSRKTTVKEENEDTLFCLSLVAKFKRIPERFRSMLQLTVLKVFNEMEWSINQQPEGQTQFMQDVSMPHVLYRNAGLGHWNQTIRHNKVSNIGKIYFNNLHIY